MAHQNRRRLPLHEALFRERHFRAVCLQTKSFELVLRRFEPFAGAPLTLYTILLVEEMASSRLVGLSVGAVELADELLVVATASIDGGGRSCALSWCRLGLFWMTAWQIW